MYLGATLLLTASLAASPALERGKLVESVASRADPTQTYTLYLPTSYAPAKKPPALLVLDPRSRSVFAAEIFREAAEAHGWILLSSNQSRSDEATDPNERVIRTLLPEAVRVYGADPRRLYIAGFSGTAIVSWAVASTTGGVAGIIGVGGRIVDRFPPESFNFAHYGFAGDTDFNNREMREIETRLGRENKIPHRFREFSGDHGWIRPDLARLAVGWMEVVAMKQGLRSRDEASIAAELRADVADASSLEASGRGLAALRAWKAIVATYDGLAAVDEARSAIGRLSADRAVKAEEKSEARGDSFEISYRANVLGRIWSVLTALREQSMMPGAARLSHELKVSDLKRRATRDDAEGRAARRLLASVFAQTSFYIRRTLFEQREYGLAIACLGVAAEIYPERWPVHYNLGAAYARINDKARALEELRKAIAAGFNDPAQVRADEDYASLRESPAFEAVVQEIKPRDP